MEGSEVRGSNSPDNPILVVQWIEALPLNVQRSHTEIIFEKIHNEAAQPKSVSGNACVRLCGFVDHASKSTSGEISSWAFSTETIERLFSFYIEWNEFDQHRSMRLVLDLIVHLIKNNLNPAEALLIKQKLLHNLVSIIAGRSTKPETKSALKALEHFLVKTIVSTSEIKYCYRKFHHDVDGQSEMETWRKFILDCLQWMRLQFVCPSAGKFIVCLYLQLRQTKEQQRAHLSIDIWHDCLLGLLNQEPSLMEQIKNHILLPLFKTDRKEALLFLQRVNELQPISSSEVVSIDVAAILQLAALEVGKRVGLVEEPALGDESSFHTDDFSITLREKILENVLAHTSQEVRSLAFSILIASPSTTKPYSITALNLLRKHLASYFADADAKFRVDMSAGARDMFKRVRGAIFVLKRSIPRARARAAKAKLVLEGQIDNETSTPVYYRTNLISLPEAQLRQCLEYHQDYLKWYLNFLCEELGPTASYQRHIASLKAINYILRLEGDVSKTWETADDQDIFFNLFNEKWARALFDLLMDAFDDVRGAAAIALKSFFSDPRYRRFSLLQGNDGGNASYELSQLVGKASILAGRTSRADHADGVARITQLLYRVSNSETRRTHILSDVISILQRKIAIAEQDLGLAVMEVPVHGDFAALCCTWQVVTELRVSQTERHALYALQNEIVRSCERVWNSVKSILCDDSPEGHLPDELEELEGLDTKGLISYSFRAIHESSNLLKVLVLSARNSACADSVNLQPAAFQRIGNLTFDQLSTLRHRGAFTTVSATFAACCQFSKHCGMNKADSRILTDWYEKTINAIYSQVSTTRRSAGIPSLITGILSANAPNPSFEDVMQELLQIARIEARVGDIDETNLPQVHAYNCLKEIFKNSLLTSLGNKKEAYLPECLELAASGLRSEVWAIRNCSLILLRSLVDCLFGTHESKSMVEAGWDGKANRIPYHRYPSLPGSLRSLLASGQSMLTQTADAIPAAESVFPALDIIRRAGPPDILRVEIQVHVVKYLSSPVWHVREMAARTLCSCLLHDKWLQEAKQIIWAGLQDNQRNQNQMHGVLLTLKFVLERLGEVLEDRLKADLSSFTSFLEECDIPSKYLDCADVVAAYVQLINSVWMFQLNSRLPLQPSAIKVDDLGGSALWRDHKLVHLIIANSQKSDCAVSIRKFLLSEAIGTNTLLSALRMLPNLWHLDLAPGDFLCDLCGLYIDIALSAQTNEVRTIAIENLSYVVDSLIRTGNLQHLPCDKVTQLWETMLLYLMNPSLTNAITRASGGLIAGLRLAKAAAKVDLRNWGRLMLDAGLEDKAFDTRFAAAESMRSYFSVGGRDYNSEEHILVLLALYDCLNDDDEEVRDIGSDTVKSILGVSLVPIEAANQFSKWLVAQFAEASLFKEIVASRLVGASANCLYTSPQSKDWVSAADQLSSSLEVDDSLFVVEKQNLFIDEVRETKRWATVFECIHWDTSDEPFRALHHWLKIGLSRLRDQLRIEDGPLGWASSPRAFAIVTRIIRSSLALNQAGVDGIDLQEEMSWLKSAKDGNTTRVSKFIIDMI